MVDLVSSEEWLSCLGLTKTRNGRNARNDQGD